MRISNLPDQQHLLERLLGTSLHIQSIHTSKELTDSRRVRPALEGLRKRMIGDIQAIDAYLKQLP